MPPVEITGSGGSTQRREKKKSLVIWNLLKKNLERNWRGQIVILFYLYFWPSAQFKIGTIVIPPLYVKPEANISSPKPS